MGQGDYSETETERSQKPVRLRLHFWKQDRLLSTKDFKRVYKAGKKIVTQAAVLYYTPNELKRYRFGITVTRKTGKAVQRNRIKRLLREAYRLNKHRLKPQQGYDLVVVVRKAGISLPFSMVEQKLMDMLSKSGILDLH